jgi:hypothetical protein
MNARIEYIYRIKIYPEDNLFILSGMNYDGIWYTAGRLNNGKIIQDNYWPLENKRFNFGNLGTFFFLSSTVREARRRGIIEAYEKEHGIDSASHIENLIGMPWEKIWHIVNLEKSNQELREVT